MLFDVVLRDWREVPAWLLLFEVLVTSWLPRVLSVSSGNSLGHLRFIQPLEGPLLRPSTNAPLRLKENRMLYQSEIKWNSHYSGIGAVWIFWCRRSLLDTWFSIYFVYYRTYLLLSEHFYWTSTQWKVSNWNTSTKLNYFIIQRCILNPLYLKTRDAYHSVIIE